MCARWALQSVRVCVCQTPQTHAVFMINGWVLVSSSDVMFSETSMCDHVTSDSRFNSVNNGVKTSQTSLLLHQAFPRQWSHVVITNVLSIILQTQTKT